MTIIVNHAGDTKCSAIYEKRTSLLTNIKWNGRAYLFEMHVSNHRIANDNIKECSEHTPVSVLDQTQRVEWLIDSVTCSDNTLQAAFGLIRANTNVMCSYFELASSSLIDVDPYRWSQRPNAGKPGASISSINFGANKGSSGVDLRWHHPKEFRILPDEQKGKLTTWQKTQKGRNILDKSKAALEKKRKTEGHDD